MRTNGLKFNLMALHFFVGPHLNSLPQCSGASQVQLFCGFTS